MSHKIHPYSFRLGIAQGWKSRWFGRKNFKPLLEEDVLIRKIISEKIGNFGIASVDIERVGNRCSVSIKSARPGLIIGRGGRGIEELKNTLEAAVRKLRREHKDQNVFILALNVEEIKRFDVSAQVVAKGIALDIEKRLPFRRTVKKTLENVMSNKSVSGAKIEVSGRLDGGEIARREWLAKGTLPLQTLRANVDYGAATAFTTYGTVGIKVWINKKSE